MGGGTGGRSHLPLLVVQVGRGVVVRVRKVGLQHVQVLVCPGPRGAIRAQFPSRPVAGEWAGKARRVRQGS